MSDRLYSGAVPEGEAGFSSLEQMGIRTVISVDGMTPDLERAARYGLRYVHLPVGYDGVPAEQGLRIARAVRDLPGPIYLHCHHGQHRGPTAAAVALLCLDPNQSITAGLEVLRQAGTDPRYGGLFRSVRELARPTSADLDRVNADFPAIAERPDMMKRMVEIDEVWQRLKQHRQADDATLLVEHYREAGRSSEIESRPADFRRRLKEAEHAASQLEQALRWNDQSAIEPALAQAARDCKRCHIAHRDGPAAD